MTRLSGDNDMFAKFDLKRIDWDRFRIISNKIGKSRAQHLRDLLQSCIELDDEGFYDDFENENSKR